MANLFFFTLWFPYKQGAEAFIENEISIAAKYFDHIYIIPMYRAGDMRTIPTNASVIEPNIIKPKDFIRGALKNIDILDLKSLIKEFFKESSFWSITHFKSFIVQSLSFITLRNSDALKLVLKYRHDDDIFYSYWGNGWGTVIPTLQGVKNTIVSRFHRFDLYSERGYIQLFRSTVLNRLDQAIFISKHGESYEHAAYPNINFDSVVSYLGTLDHGTTAKSNDGKIRVVSCSRIVKVKRVELIFKALLEINTPNIEWTHFGDGELMDNLRKLIDSSNHNFVINLPGNMSNGEIMNYYKTHMADVFVNVSSSEGLPVSIMEAISFDIPVVATNVGGTSEIVNSQTGILITSNPTSEEISKAISEILQRRFTPRQYWENNFNAENNYNKFYQNLIALNNHTSHDSI